MFLERVEIDQFMIIVMIELSPYNNPQLPPENQILGRSHCMWRQAVLSASGLEQAPLCQLLQPTLHLRPLSGFTVLQF